MYRLIWPVVLAALALVRPAMADSLIYEIYKLEGGNDRTLLASGTKNYDQSDVRVVERDGGDGDRFWNKSVVVWDDFSVGASIWREPSLTGFGLWIDRSRDGFSWEWFCVEKEDLFTKLQGPGKVRVETSQSEGGVELAAVEFLTDVTLRGRFSWWPFSTAKTHHVVLKKGSVLRLAP